MLMRRAVTFNGRLKTMPYYTQLRAIKSDIKRYTDKYKKVLILKCVDAFLAVLTFA